MTEEWKPNLPMSGADFLAELKTRHPDLDFEPKSPGEMVSYIRSRYLKPNWPHWANMAEVSLQQAVWLSLDIEPWKEGSGVDEAIEGISKRPAPVMQRWYSVQLRDSLRNDYQPRMAQCLAAIKAKVLSARWRDTTAPHLIHDLTVRWYVSLEQFRQWGESLRHPHTFPDEFPRAAPAEPKIPPILTEEGALTPYAGGVTRVDAEYDERLRDVQSSVTDAAPRREAPPLRPDTPTAEATSERAYDPLSTTATAADEYFRQQNARLAAQVAKFANEAGYAELVASVDAKDLHLNLAPDWPHWANMAYVTVGDAACLSLGISPEARLPQINLSDVRKRAQEFNVAAARVQLGLAALERAQRTIQQRVTQAMSAIEAGQLPSARRSFHQILGLTSSQASVRLPRYRLWAESLPEPYVFPEGFPPGEPHSEPIVHSSAQPEQPVIDHEKPMGKRERDTLLTIVAALAKELSIDVSQPSKAAAAIEELTTKVGARVAQRTIENHLKRISDALDSKSD